MGACDFYSRAKGKTPEEAFWRAVEEARWEYGNGGYSGTIAEKSEFQIITVPDGQSAASYASELLDEDDERISDKWGPAGCLKVKDGEYLFVGWASW